MIVLSWNVRGLNAKIKRSALRKIISHHNPHFIFVQETKLENFTPKYIKSIWNLDDIGWIHSPSDGNSGGLLTMWRNDYFTLESSRIDRNWIAIMGSFPSLSFVGCLVNVYNPCDIGARSDCWTALSNLWTESQSPSLYLGDFNEVLAPNERGSQIISNLGVSDFQNFIQRIHLTEIQARNGWFTWFRGQAKSKLDRLLVNPEWISIFPSLQVSLLRRGISDHCPILVSSTEQDWGPKPFKFLDCWLSHPRCMKVIRDSWEKCTSHNVLDKLKLTRMNLKEWNLSDFDNIDHRISSLEEKIHDFDSLSNERSLTDLELAERREA